MAGGSVNKVILVGNLGKDPELRYTSSGKAVCDFSVATSESFGKGTDREEQTEWHRVVVWEKLAELCGEYLSKGRKVYVEGRLQTRKWTDRDNNERYTTEVIARDVVFLSGRDDGGGGGGGGGRAGGGGGGGGGGGAGYRRNEEPQGGERERGGSSGRPPANAPRNDDRAPAFDDDDIPF